MALPKDIEALSEALRLDPGFVERLAARRVIEIREWRGVRYARLRYNIAGFEAGTVVTLPPSETRVLKPHPGFTKVLLPSRVMPSYFPDKVVVEEYIVGYEVRVALVDGRLTVFTREGLLCPYTLQRISRRHPKLAEALKSSSEELLVYGVVAGTENPYTRFYRMDAGGFTLYMLDVAIDGRLKPIHERNAFAEEAGTPQPPQIASIARDDLASWRKVMDEADRRGFMGLVLRDPLNRVKPLLYRTSFANIYSLELLARELPRTTEELVEAIVALVLNALEEGWDAKKLLQREIELGRSLLEPLIDLARMAEKDRVVREEFTLRFGSSEELQEFLVFADEVGLEARLQKVEVRNGEIIARFYREIPASKLLRTLTGRGLGLGEP